MPWWWVPAKPLQEDRSIGMAWLENKRLGHLPNDRHIAMQLFMWRRRWWTFPTRILEEQVNSIRLGSKGGKGEGLSHVVKGQNVCQLEVLSLGAYWIILLWLCSWDCCVIHPWQIEVLSLSWGGSVLCQNTTSWFGRSLWVVSELEVLNRALRHETRRRSLLLDYLYM